MVSKLSRRSGESGRFCGTSFVTTMDFFTVAGWEGKLRNWNTAKTCWYLTRLLWEVTRMVGGL